MSQIKYFNVKHNIDEFQGLSNRLVIGNGDYLSYSNFLPNYNFFLCNPQTETEKSNLSHNCLTCEIDVIFCIVNLEDDEQVSNFVETFINFFDYIYLDSNCHVSLNINNVNSILKSKGIYEVTNAGFKDLLNDSKIREIDSILNVMIEKDDYSGVHTKRQLRNLYDRYFLLSRIYFSGSNLVTLKSICQKLIVILLSIEMESIASRITYGESLIAKFEELKIFDLDNLSDDFHILMNTFIFTIGSILFKYNPEITAVELIENDRGVIVLNKYFIKE